jgi:hypothetical protein
MAKAKVISVVQVEAKKPVVPKQVAPTTILVNVSSNEIPAFIKALEIANSGSPDPEVKAIIAKLKKQIQ